MSVDGVGIGRIKNLLAKFRSTESVLTASIPELMEVEGLSVNLAQRIQRCNNHRHEIENVVNEELERLFKINGSLITLWDKEYPSLLRKIYDPPILLYTKGKFHDADDYSIAVVGTRQPTNYGKIQAERIISELAEQNITIVSGMARGIDSIAHRIALKNKSRTIAVLGSGLNVIYPPENKKLYDEISESGVVITEYSLDTKPDAVNFPKRNRIISGLSLGCVIIETGITGGAMQTAALALDQGREVFAVPGNLGIRQSEGTNLLIQKGEAELTTSAEDILIELELKLKPVIGKNIPKPDIQLTLFEEKILAHLNNEPLQIDLLASKTNMSTSDCLVHLLSLEFKGVVRQLPGKMFMRL
ncbi:MAG: DNA protecting protein DprA [Ignavibacteria bacterium RIFOXYB2_FULL_35_12]|nr:MAG: DNA protecting protein DprA [Ignavibacteria bacterium GWA2_36_19]OGU50741.1 MAG: DNA protecting protein DprA [Ignavibacteria bacterium GWC2_35_8]OGU61416.1 MAG: DNA protecting protein DprA [Ignavibacteria bacterium GWF2_35_20]OGU78860.1 MAG: DNA protecting protein DprA [Ignavibacteria bacterium RIFOXYA2_FULL_35_9]OGU85449.1 MAG: DNA protecting protein DprA [Ignavibacteria bacterium RIFOXYA12_FULL_35_25]OGU90217.1 MAG: DNA protecting protein DprA [Ignavibacteria bacterium RIFOXYC12_FULL